MKKIVINNCYGGFSLNNEAFKEYCKRKGIPVKEHTTKYSGGFSSTSLWGVLGPDDDLETPGKGKDLLNSRGIERDDSTLIAIVEEWGKKANGSCASLKVVEIPNNVEWEIEEYDGNEWIAEKHRTWR